MKVSTSASVSTSSTTLLSGWVRALLILPALAGLVLGLYPLFLPKQFAELIQFPPDDVFLYQLGAAAALGFGIGLSGALFMKDWLAVRLPVIGVLVYSLASLYACAVQIITGPTPSSVYVVLVVALLSIAISSLLLARHRGVAHLEPNLDNLPMRLLLLVGALAAGFFGLAPLLVPNLFTVFHLHINAPFVVRLAGACSLGYAVMAALAQRALHTKEIFLIGLMAAIFNGVGGIVSLFYLRSDILFLPWLIAPVGLLVFVCLLLVLRQSMRQKV